MIFRSLGLLAVFSLALQASHWLPSQATSHAVANPQTAATPATQGSAVAPATQGSPVKPDCNGVPCEDQQPRFVVTLPQPAPPQWLLHDRVELGAKLALALLGYVGILVALSTLKKMERGTRASEETAQAALETAQAALLNAQSLVRAQRPWLMVSVKPSPTKESSFTVMATNRGSTPAILVSTRNAIQFAVDETQLPATPEYESLEGKAPQVPVILVQGESVAIKSFSRDEVEELCGSKERFRRIQEWEEKLFLRGRIVYRDLIAPPDEQMHATNWCCWYIHGRQKSGLVMSGPESYNGHS